MIMIDKELLGKIIQTLKMLDVKGFESMDMLVGCVSALMSVYNNTPESEETEQQEA